MLARALAPGQREGRGVPATVHALRPAVRYDAPADLALERGRLLVVLQLVTMRSAACVRPYRAVSWSTIEAAAEARAQRPDPARTVPPGRDGAPRWALEVMQRSELGMGPTGRRRGARGRLAVCLAVARELARWDGGMRGEELSAATGITEATLWPVLAWAAQRGVLVDRGERGWFLPPASPEQRKGAQT